MGATLVAHVSRAVLVAWRSRACFAQECAVLTAATWTSPAWVRWENSQCSGNISDHTTNPCLVQLLSLLRSQCSRHSVLLYLCVARIRSRAPPKNASSLLTFTYASAMSSPRLLGRLVVMLYSWPLHDRCVEDPTSHSRAGTASCRTLTSSVRLCGGRRSRKQDG